MNLKFIPYAADKNTDALELPAEIYAGCVRDEKTGARISGYFVSVKGFRDIYPLLSRNQKKTARVMENYSEQLAQKFISGLPSAVCTAENSVCGAKLEIEIRMSGSVSAEDGKEKSRKYGMFSPKPLFPRLTRKIYKLYCGTYVSADVRRSVIINGKKEIFQRKFFVNLDIGYAFTGRRTDILS